MISRDKVYDLIHSLKSHTLSAVRANNKRYVPEVLTDRTDNWQNKIFAVDRYHYKDRWYSYRYSDDNPELTIGIIKTFNLPYWTFKDKNNKRSFYASLEKLVALRYITPIWLFIDNHYIPWKYIDLVYDCGTTYIILNGEQYNYFYLKNNHKFNIVRIPYNVEYLSPEDDNHFNRFYNALTQYMDESQYLDDNRKIHVAFPTIHEVYKIEDVVYDIGWWVYKQLKYYELNMLSQDRVSKLKKIELDFSVKDALGNSVERYNTRFNMLDNDSFDMKLYNDICYRDNKNYNLYNFISFTEDGICTNDGKDKFYLFDDSVYIDYHESWESVIYHDHSEIDNILQRENYLVFKDGLLDADCEITTGPYNLIRINNPDNNWYRVYTFYYKKLEPVYQTHMFKFNKPYIIEKAKKYFDETRWSRGLYAILMRDNGELTDRILYNIDLYGEPEDQKPYIFDPDGNLDEGYKLAGLLLDEKENESNTLFKNLELSDITGYSHDPLKIMLVAAPISEADEEGEFSPGFVVRSMSNRYTKVYIKDGKAYYEELAQPDEYDKVNGTFTMFLDYFDIEGKPIDKEHYMSKIIVWLNDKGLVDVQLLGSMNVILGDGTTLNNIMAHVYEDDHVYDMPLESIVLIDHTDEEYADFIDDLNMCLDFKLTKDKTYEDNMDSAIEEVIKYDAIIFNRLNTSYVDSYTATGAQCNENLAIEIEGLPLRGLKIPRNRYKDVESYCLVFLNGILLEEYNKMVVYNNYFFIPYDKEFVESDELEVVWYNECNNSEIHINYNDFRTNYPDDTKVFQAYPQQLIQYPTLVKPSNEIAFNVSYRDNGELKLLDNIEKDLILVSSRRFCYQRITVDKKSYRMRLNSRFKYCDNKAQYMVYINGRRINEDEFFITTPKVTRPFWANYLYTTRFINPEDRVDVFYLPISVKNMNVGELSRLPESGYIEADSALLQAPFDPKLYGFWVGGKKIAACHINMVSSNIIRVSKDYMSTEDLIINHYFKDITNESNNYMDSEFYSRYDSMIYKIRKSSYLGLDELDRLFNIYVKMSNYDNLYSDTGYIAVLNEIVRDFWVSSGYDYNNKPFLYDYDADELFSIDENGNYIIPSLDANQIINIPKEDLIHILYFRPKNEQEFYEVGSKQRFEFIWDYSEPEFDSINPLNIVSQNINEYNIDPLARSYMYPEMITDNTKFTFTGNDDGRLMTESWNAEFVLPIYYGIIDEARIRNYKRSNIVNINDIIALVPKSGNLPTTAELEWYMEHGYVIEDMYRDNFIFRNLTPIFNADMLLPSVMMSDLIAIMPQDDEFLMDDKALDKLAEEGLEYAKEHYWWEYLDDTILLIDPNINMDLVWLRTLKAIVPEDWHDVMGYHEDLDFEKITDKYISLNESGNEMLKDDNNYHTLSKLLLFDAFNENTLLGEVNELLYSFDGDDENYILFESDDKNNFTSDDIVWLEDETPASYQYLTILPADNDEVILIEDFGELYAYKLSDSEWDALGNNPEDYETAQSIIGNWTHIDDFLVGFDYIGKHDSDPIKMQKAREIPLDDETTWLMDLNINDAELTRNFFAIKSDISVLQTDFRERNLVDRSMDQWSELDATGDEEVIYAYIEDLDEYVNISFDEDWYDPNNPASSQYMHIVRFLMGGSNQWDNPDADFDRHWANLLGEIDPDSDEIEITDDFHDAFDTLTDILKVQLYISNKSDFPRYTYITPDFMFVYDEEFLYNEPSTITVFGGVKGWKPKENKNNNEYLEDLAAIFNTSIDNLSDISLDDIEDPVVKDLSLRPATDNSISNYEGLMAIIMNEDGSLSDRVINEIGTATTARIPDSAVNLDDPDMFALLEDGERWYTKFKLSNVITDGDIKSDSELDLLIAHLNKKLLRDAECNLDYPMGNYNNFIMAFPSKYVYNNYKRRAVDFFTTDIKNQDLLNHTYLRPSTPLYTSGVLNIQRQLTPLDQMNMVYMGECNYTSEYGITEPYTVFRTDGFFTRLYEDYNINFKVQNR